MRAKFCAVAVIVGICSPAGAENWIEISKSTHSTAYIDKDSADRSGTHVKFWMRTVSDAEHPIGIYGGKPMTGPNIQGVAKFVEMRSQIDLDCSTRTFTNPYVKFHDRAGTVVSEASSVVTEPKPFGPNAMVASGADLFCPKP